MCKSGAGVGLYLLDLNLHLILAIGFEYRRSDREDGFTWNFVAMPCKCFIPSEFYQPLI
jgi:hypothetical protein